ncbi:SDR family NAD(P)-dependent oxidoreductase [Streptomyces sp. NPDC052496]|uniref:SDR family NAD(P)-dependent oxidoreductase n=1 Tax=Streptomyces sp. NPDC052496 TaxID=3154951 RepID=UPI0034385B1C
MADRQIPQDDIAVIGMACRFPGGVDSPEALWELVRDGKDAVGDFPVNRGWDTDDLYEARFVRQGGFLHDADTFDAEFFGIKPAEATAMDPQQRILLETAWEALERSGIVPSSLKGSRTGVFVGLMTNEYGMPLWKWQEGETAGFMGTGTSPSVASGRISYLLGLEGPALTIDTACSSSGVAIHTAVRSLRSGETDLALAAGTNVLAGPGMFVDFAKKGALSPSGRCRTFSDSADGTVWAEGAGVLILEPLAKARRLGRRVLGVIKGTAVNQDGASNGLTAPNGRAQIKVINQALADARLAPQDIQLVEAHGTATKLGDPIEANAIQATYGQGERREPVWLGSLKSNIGHSMAAAGVGGVIKCLTAMRAQVLPRTLHVEGDLNSHVDWTHAVEVLRENRPWPAVDGVRRCAVSSFGVSGTNAHVILESWEEDEPVTPAPETDEPRPAALKLSAKTPTALRSLATAVAGRLEAGTDAVAGLAHALAHQREDFDHRAVVVGTGRTELLDGLRAFTAGAEHPGAVDGVARRVRRPVFVFPGQGSQWQGMATALLRESEVFRARIEECSAAFAPHLDYDVTAALAGTDDTLDMERTDVVQPLIFSMMLGLAAMWQHAGVRPAAVVGHSQGEVAAACVAGALSLEDAARVVACRSQALETSGRGAMAAVATSAAEATGLVREVGADLVIAATNGPDFVVVSGDDAPGIQRLLDLCEDRGIYARPVPAKCASHSPAMADLQDDIIGGLSGLTPVAGTLPMFSTVDVRRVDGTELTAEYWYRNLRHQVRFAETVVAATTHGYDAFLEMSPHPVLVGSIRSALEQAGNSAPVCATMKRDQGGYARFLTAVAEAYTQGHPVDWGVLCPDDVPQRPTFADLPTYPFERRRYWLHQDMGAAGTSRREHRPASLLSDGGHPWISTVIETADGRTLMAGRLSVRSHPWLMDHRVEDTALLPGTAFAELLLSAGQELGCAALDELLLSDPLLLPMDGTAVEIQLAVEPADAAGARAAAISSRTTGTDTWVRNAQGLLSAPRGPAPSGPTGLPAAQDRPQGAGELYEALRAMGYGYGEAFQGVRTAEQRGEWVLSDVALPAAAQVNHRGFTVHPALVDAALHAAVRHGLMGEPGAGRIAVPFLFSGVRLGSGPVGDSCRAAARPVGPDAVALTLTDADGRLLLSVDRMVVRGLSLPGAQPDLDAAALYAMQWDPVADDAAEECRICVVGADGRDLTTLVRDAARGGISVATLDEAAMVTRGLPGAWQVVLPAPGLAGTTGEQVHASAEWALETIQQWLRNEEIAGRVPLAFVTQDAVTVPGDATSGLEDSALWGLVRSAQTEYPDHFRIVDVSSCTAADAGTVATALTRSEPQLAVRGDRVLRPQLVPYAAAEGARPDLGRGTVVITGGTGTIGREVARHLITEWGAQRLTLLSRSGDGAPGVAAFRSELEALGAAVQVLAADTSDAQSVQAALAKARTEGPIAGLVHAAGVLDDSIVTNMTPAQLHTVLRSKVDSALHLDAATRDDDLQFFVLFSSLYGVLGGPGQANYAAANTFLDQFAAWRRAQGQPAEAIAWGLWSQASGMTGHLGEGDLLRLRRNGVAAFDVDEGLALFDAALTSEATALVAARLAFPEPGDAAGLGGPFLLETLTGQRDRAAGQVPAGTTPVRHAPVRPAPAEPRGAATPPSPAPAQQEATDVLTVLASGDASRDQRLAALLALVKESVGGLLGTEADRVDAERSFYEMGFDSLTSMELRVRLGRRLGMRLGATVVFDHPTPEALAAHVLELFGAADGEAAPTGAGQPAATDTGQSAPAREDAGDRGSSPGRREQAEDRSCARNQGQGQDQDQDRGQGQGEDQDQNRASVPAPAGSDPFPLTKLQEAYLAGRAGDFELGNVSTYLYIEVDLTAFDVQRAETALRALITRHPMLRAVFDEPGAQRVLGDVPAYRIHTEDLRALTAAERDQRLAALRAELKAHTFDTAVWPLFLVRATHLDGTVTRLHVGIDVLISDGGSSALLFDEWAELYRDPQRALPEPESTFEEFARAARAFCTSEDIAPSRQYWQDRAATLPLAPDLPRAVRLSDIDRPVFSNRFLRIDAPQWQAFQRNAAAAGTTASSALLAAYCTVLARWSKTPDFTVNVLVSNRAGFTPQDMSRVVGNFSSTNLLEVHADPAVPFRELAGAIQRQLVRDMEHAAYTGLDVLRDLSRLDGDAGRARMPVVFNSTIGGAAKATDRTAGPVGALCRMGESGTPVWSGVRTPQVILDHTAFEEQGSLILNWDVVEEAFPTGVVDEMFAAYERLIHELCR